MQRGAGSARLQAADLAAAAHLLVVQERHVADLTGEPGLAVVEPSVQDHAHAEAPAEVDGQHVGRIDGMVAGEVFAVGHRPRVVLDRDGDVEILFENGVERQVVAHEITHRIAFLRVDAPAEAHPDAEHLLPGDAGRRHGLLDQAAEGLEGVCPGLQDKLDVRDEIDGVALEVGDAEMEVLPGDVDSDEVAGRGVEAENARTAASGGADLAHVHHVALFDQLADDLGDRRDAGVELAGQVRDGIIVVEDAQAQDMPLDVGVLAAVGQKVFRTHFRIVVKFGYNVTD